MAPATAASLAYGRTLAEHERTLTHLQLWRSSVATYPDSLALVARHQKAASFPWMHPSPPLRADDACVQWTYAQLDHAARLLATRLQSQAASPDRPIAVLVNTQAEWPLFFWAAAYLRQPLVPINPKAAAKGAEVSHMIRLTQPGTLVVADSTIAKDLESNLDVSLWAEIPTKIMLADSTHSLKQPWTSLHHLLSASTLPAAEYELESSPTDEALIVFTSGTTSLPKPCAQSSFNTSTSGRAYAEARDIQAHHKFIQNLPNFHSYGIAWSVCFWSAGGTVILPSNAFEAQSSLQAVHEFRATHMSLVPTTARTMLAHPIMEELNLSSLVSIDVSGADVIPVVVNSCVEGFKTPSYTSYGMTESPGTLIWPQGGGSVLLDGAVAAGKPARGTCVKVCAPGGRDPLPRGEVGELHNGGVQVIQGYRDPNISSSAFYQDTEGTQWVVTGDQAVMKDDGSVLISGRYKDIIIRGGENISPATIEDLLTKADGVSMAQVVGVPDEMAGEVPIAVITTQHETRVDVGQLKNMAAQQLGPAFAPKMVLHLKDDLARQHWPTTTSGKVRKVELRAMVNDYLKKKEEQASSQQLSTIDTLLRIWANVSGHDALTPESSIQSFADSLMMMQLSSMVKHALSRNISVEDYKLCETIQDQANLIDSRPARRRGNTVKKEQRTGPPTVAHIPHLQGNARAFDTTKALISANLEAQDLSWDDVEDVIQLPNWDAIFAHRSRPTSWTIRFVYQASVSPEKLLAAIHQSLEYHPTFRSIAMEMADDTALLIPMRPNQRWFKAAVTSGWEVDTTKDLARLLLEHPEHDSAVAPGPMMKLHVAKVRSDGTSGLVLVGSHAVMDMSMTKLWLEDMATLLGGGTHIVPHEQFKDYAEAYHKHCQGADAQTGVAYWAKKHQGISALPESSFWPLQRAPEWFKGADEGWRRWSGVQARRGERSIAAEDKRRAQAGIRRTANVRDLAQLKADHDVPVFMLVKAALVLLNIIQTGGKEAVFGTINAARTWPFQNDYTSMERAGLSGNPLDIAGCTTEYVLDRVPVDKSRRVAAFMQDVTADEELNSSFVHAPFTQVVDRLRDPLSDADPRTFAQRERDAEALMPLIRRQSFNWLPMPPTGGAPDGPGLRFQEQRSRMDNGLTVTGFLAEDKKTVCLSMAWDPEHLSISEANHALELLARLVETMGKAENWGLTVAGLLALLVQQQKKAVVVPEGPATKGMLDSIMQIWDTRGRKAVEYKWWMRSNVHKAEF